MQKKKVLVSGNFDLLHNGHIEFLKQASSYGDVYVCVGRDNNAHLLNKKSPLYNEQERLFIVENIKCVKKAMLAHGSGMLDFAPNMIELKPDCFVVNKDGSTSEKREFCEKLGVDYIEVPDVPKAGLPKRTSAEVKTSTDTFPYRICLAGGWIDQPFVNKYASGSIVVVSIKSQMAFNDRSGMATSSRKTAYELWNGEIPKGRPPHVLAKLLFGAENPPGSLYVSGAQDQIGLLVPGISKLEFGKNEYWPRIRTIEDKGIADWLESVIELIPLEPRPVDYNPLATQNLNSEDISILGRTGEKCFKAIESKNAELLGESLMETWQMWQKILPNTVNDYIIERAYELNKMGFGFSGSNGGYIIRVKEPADPFTEGAIKISVRLS